MLSDVLTMPKMSGADIGLKVVYRPWLLPWHEQQTFHFVAQRLAGGQLYWRVMPASH